VRAVRNLEVVNVIKLPQDFAGPIVGFQWSPSSRLLLVSNPAEIRVVSALDDSFNATIRNPVATGTKPAHVGFGVSDAEVCVIASFGMKFAVYNLASSKAVEIGNPKLFSSSAAARCFSFRPRTHHLALLTRTAGKDHVSLHTFPTRELQRSWAPDTIDAQGLLWSPDGRWLVLWESAAQGHKLLFYTSDGHIFRTWSGPTNPAPEYKDYAAGAGIRTVQFSADGRYLAIGDYSRSLYLFNMTSVTETMRLQHPSSLVPRDTLQVRAPFHRPLRGVLLTVQDLAGAGGHLAGRPVDSYFYEDFTRYLSLHPASAWVRSGFRLRFGPFRLILGPRSYPAG
jgi:WD40 repeat protein